MTEKFILVNGRILDFRQYKSDFALLQRMIVFDLSNYFRGAGFNQSQRRRSTFSGTLKFYNGELDMEVVCMIRKRSQEEFV
ncbi:hypothetical protein HYU12_02350 [Candidatus Woesearchaeota archaeon]|nr:hypothetical protein [Candidatus Woesearchaeota archaeon]